MDVYELVLPTNGDVRIALTTGTILGVVIGLHDLLQDILESAGELEKRAPYDDLVTTKFAAIAAQ